MRNGLVATTVLAVAVALDHAPAVAQDHGRRSPIEFGAAVNGWMVNDYQDFFSGGPDAPALDLRVTVPVSPRFSAETVVTVGHHGTWFVERIEGLYVFQLKQRLRRTTRGGFHAFLTYGAAGYWAHVSLPETEIPQPGGGIAIRPRTTYREIDEPLAAIVGAGVQHAFSRHLAFRAEAQMISVLFIPIGPRFSAGVSLPLGAYQ